MKRVKRDADGIPLTTETHYKFKQAKGWKVPYQPKTEFQKARERAQEQPSNTPAA